MESHMLQIKEALLYTSEGSLTFVCTNSFKRLCILSLIPSLPLIRECLLEKSVSMLQHRISFTWTLFELFVSVTCISSLIISNNRQPCCHNFTFFKVKLDMSAGMIYNVGFITGVVFVVKLFIVITSCNVAVPNIIILWGCGMIIAW